MVRHTAIITFPFFSSSTPLLALLSKIRKLNHLLTYRFLTFVERYPTVTRVKRVVAYRPNAVSRSRTIERRVYW